jgi:hypothetical protein
MMPGEIMMDVPMQQLTNQLARIEREMNAIRQELARLEQPVARGSLPLAAAGPQVPWADKQILRERFAQLLAAQAVTGQPHGALALQEQMAHEGLEPNELSRELSAARDD